MLKVTYKTLETAKLPLSACRGSETQRFAMSRQMSKRLLSQLSATSCSTDNLTNIVNRLLKPNKINFILEDVTENKALGATRFDIGIAAGNETIDVGIKGYKILLKRLKNGLYDKYTAVHEFGHLFDHIYNPKINKFSSVKLIFNEEILNKSSKLKDLFINQIEEMQEVKKVAQVLLKEIPDEYAIDALQSIRCHLKTEIHQYQFGLKTLFKAGEFGDFSKEFILSRKLKYRKKLKFANKLLKERLEIARRNLADSNNKF